MSLNIHISNRMENLVSALADLLRRPLASPLTPEVIVMQSKGMQRWLAMELAQRFGVWANCDYPFPNAMVWRLFGQLLREIPEPSPFSSEVMTWKIMDLLPQFLDDQYFTPLRRYLGGESRELKLFQLAEKIADSFDQYTLFRPEMLLDWEEGEWRQEETWQALLWRELARWGEGRHRARLKREYCSLVGSAGTLPSGIPERIALFGISYLPDYHIKVLAATARITEVNLFLLSPTREYWSDILSRRAMARLPAVDESLHAEGNPLLASLGRLGRDFSDTVLQIGDLAMVQQELYHDAGEDTLLHSVQSQILNLTGTGEGGGRRLLSDDDRSVQIHSCHSPLREIEVLHDNILNLLEREEGLEPRQIVVMTPDIETYTPFIAAVFAGERDSGVRIPYSIADRSLASEGEVASVLLKLLQLPGSRLTVVQLLEILEQPPVGRRFGLDGDDLAEVRGWLERTRVAWGIDEQDRLQLGLPGYRENSWKAGLDRLLLGYAMPEEGGSLFNDLLPFDDMEGASPQVLGRLLDFVQAVADLARGLSQARSLEGWAASFRSMLADFIVVDDGTARELDQVGEILATMLELGERSGFEGEVDPVVIRSWFAARLQQEQRGFGFMTGGVTFCAMLPMRSIPFRVVALIGMSDGAFPRQARPPGFDLIAASPRRGDRSLREEDRYLFLEAILSARDVLYLSYVGQNIRDNSRIPPSVLVSEFMDAVGREFTAGEGGMLEERLVTRHPLQAFAREYFRGESLERDARLFSYSAENRAALAEKCAADSPLPGFMVAPLDEPPEQWRELTLAGLISFFANPARYFLERRLGIRLEEIATPLDEREPFDLAGLEAYSLRQELCQALLEGDDPEQEYPVARARGILPPGRHGRILFDQALAAAGTFAGQVRERMGEGDELPRLDFDLTLGSFRLNGSLDGIRPERLVRYRCAKLKPGDLLRGWLEHLLLNLLRPERYPRETMLVMADGVTTFSPVDDAATLLESLLDLYWQGLCRPLRFFPFSSLEYAHKLEWKIERAEKVWKGWEKHRGEGEDPVFRLCFGGGLPFDDEFQRIARTVLEPLLRCRG